MVAMLQTTAFGKDDKTVVSDTTNTYTDVEWVDLGLPSGLLWAKCNLGATAPYEYGGHYAWGETWTKSAYSWASYIHSNGESNKLTKYCCRSSEGSFGYKGFLDKLTTLQPADDAATAKLGNGARIPTYNDWIELMTNTSSEWTTLHGTKGMLFTAPNGNTLFLPAAGAYVESSCAYRGEGAYYWSSSLFTGMPESAWTSFFNDDDAGLIDAERCEGRSVRPVRSAK